MRKRKAQAANVAAEVRGAFLRAIKMSEEDGRPLSQIMLDLLQKDEDALKLLMVVSKFIPKELMVEQKANGDIAEMTDTDLDREIERLVAEEVNEAIKRRAARRGLLEQRTVEGPSARIVRKAIH